MKSTIEKVPIKIIVSGLPNEFVLKVEKAFQASNYKGDGTDLTKIARTESRIQIFAKQEIADEIIKNLKNEGLKAW